MNGIWHNRMAWSCGGPRDRGASADRYGGGASSERFGFGGGKGKGPGVRDLARRPSPTSQGLQGLSSI